MSAEITKKRILDAAERLFAQRGFHNTSLREITKEAGVNVASVNYHFGTRQALISEVIARRLGPINRERIRRLEIISGTYGVSSGDSFTGQILRAFIEPSINFLETEPAARDFLRIMGQGMADTDETIRHAFLEQVRPVFAMMIRLLGQALPDLPSDVIHFRLHCFIGAFAHWMRLVGSDSYLSGSTYLDDPQKIMAELLLFCNAGMEAPV